VSRDTAYILFTSGSTGRPKGVRLTHANLAAYFRTFDSRYEFAPDDVFSQTLGLNFDCSLVDMFGAWAAGSTVQVVPALAFGDLPGFAAEHGLTVWFSTPSAIALVRRMGGLRPGALPGLRLSYFAGEALLCADAERWQHATGGVVENLYGPAELTITVTSHRYSPRSRELAVNGVVPIGRLHGDHDGLLLGPDGEPAADEGELCITGPQMSPGYLNPEQDHGTFVQREGRTWYHTGDRVRRLANGELAYLGRSDSQVQVHGLRVELAEVDQAVRDLPGVTDAVTVPVHVDATTELAVFYTGTKVAPMALARRLREVLPAAMVPRQLRHLEEFPLNVNRKVDRGLLAKLALES
jgi:non-ribosomal peptide synthetase component F